MIELSGKDLLYNNYVVCYEIQNKYTSMLYTMRFKITYLSPFSYIFLLELGLVMYSKLISPFERVNLK